MSNKYRKICILHQVVCSQHNKVSSSYSESRLTSSSRYLPFPPPSYPRILLFGSLRAIIVAPLPVPCLYTQSQQVGFTRKRAQRARPCCKSKLGNVALDIDRFNHSVAVKFLVIYPYNVLFLYNKWCSVLDKLLNKVTKL